MLDWLTSLLKNPVTYAVLIALAFFSWGMIGKYTKKLPVINKRNSFIVVMALAFLFFGGYFTAMGFGSVTYTGTSIIDSQITTSFATDIGGSVSVSTSTENTLDVRLTDAQANETDGLEELVTGVIRLKRTGDLSADSCEVKAYVPADYLNQDGSDQTTLYHLIERDSLGNIEVYLEGAASSTAASLTSPKGVTSLPFAEGVDTAYLGVMFEADEEGHDAMIQYNSLPVVVNACGEVYTFNVFRMD